MKSRVIFIAILAAILAGSVAWPVVHNLMAQTNAPAANRKILYYTCPMHPSVKPDKPGGCPVCGMDLIPVYGTDVATNSATSNATNHAAADPKPKPYPLATCVVDGMELGSMGPPYVFVYQRQEIKFCCAGCKPEFLKNATNYLKKIQDAQASPSK